MVFRFNNKVKIIGAYKLLRCETWELLFSQHIALFCYSSDIHLLSHPAKGAGLLSRPPLY